MFLYTVLIHVVIKNKNVFFYGEGFISHVQLFIYIVAQGVKYLYVLSLTSADCFQATWTAPYMNNMAVSEPTSRMMSCPSLLFVRLWGPSFLEVRLTWAKPYLSTWKSLLATCRTACLKSARVKLQQFANFCRLTVIVWMQNLKDFTYAYNH